ncbi:cytochrome P450 [Micromonospora violae]|uniref:cytochrome P450 n=1 Tax=Micromonospora violae TaxID=1278207 RepID=UPI0033D0BF89
MELESFSTMPYDKRVVAFYDYLRRRQAEGAAGPSSRPAAFEVFRYAEGVQVLTDHATFSSDMTGAISADQEQLAQAASGHLAGVDPPRHTVLRSMVSSVFTPRVVADIEPRIALLAEQVLDRAVAGAPDGRIDVVHDYAAPLTATVIAELFGIPDADHDKFAAWADLLLGAKPPEEVRADAAAQERIGELLSQVFGYFLALIDDRRRNPGDDLTTALTRAEIDGRPLSPEEIIGVVSMFLLAGYLPSSVLIGNVLMALDEHPATFAALRARPERLPAVVEEVLRWRPPLARDVRVATRDVELDGTLIPAGSTVCVWLAAANRDERRWPDPDTFDIDRPHATNLAWGRGIHHCLGSALARLEVTVALRTLLRRYPDLRLDREREVRFHPSLGILGPARLPILTSPATP